MFYPDIYRRHPSYCPKPDGIKVIKAHGKYIPKKACGFCDYLTINFLWVNDSQDYNFVVHHINGNAFDNNYNNLKLLCRCCHNLVHSSDVFYGYLIPLEVTNNYGRTYSKISFTNIKKMLKANGVKNYETSSF